MNPINPINSLSQKNLSQKNYNTWINHLREKYYNHIVNDINNNNNNNNEFYESFENDEDEPDIENQLRKRSEDDISDYEDEIDNVLKKVDHSSSNKHDKYKNKDITNEYDYDYEKDYEEGRKAYYEDDIECKYCDYEFP